MTALSKRPTRRLSARYCRAVTFFWRDDAAKNARKTLTLDAVEFLHRFPMHVLPPRSTRVRYNGFLANRDRSVNVAKARELIASKRPLRPRTPIPNPRLCPQCHKGTMRRGPRVDPQCDRTWFDTSEHDDPFRPGRSSIVVAA